MNKKTFRVVICALFLAHTIPAESQQPKKIPRIAYVAGRSNPTPTDPDPSTEAFRQGLRDRGYIEGKNILIEYRYLEGKLDRVPSIVAELVQLKVDVLVSPNLFVIRLAKQATKTIPIVMVTTVDPVATGLIDSLAHPGGNITGVTRLTQELRGKRLELFKDVVPGISRVGVLWTTSDASSAVKDYEPAARALKIALLSLKMPASNPDLEGVFRDAVKGRVSGIITPQSTALLPYWKKIADLAIKNRLPSMFESSTMAEFGGLVSYSSNNDESYKRAAYFVDRILKGAKPADLPVEQPMKFEFVINLKTAKQLGLTIPQSVLYRADKVIQ